MIYTEIGPGRALAPYVACYWTSDIPAGQPPAVHRVLPDGCVDLLFNLGSPILRLEDDGPEQRPEGAYVVGVMRRAVRVVRSGGMRIFAVRFRPGGAAAFLPFAQHELADRMAPLADGWGETAGHLAEQLHAAPGPAACVRLVEAALGRHYRPEPRAEAVLGEAVRRIEQTGGQVAVERLAEELGVGTRRLERLFDARVGQSPKQLCRVVRLHHTLDTLRAGPPGCWTRTALDGGYYDQSHFIREVRALTGATPTELVAAWR